MLPGSDHNLRLYPGTGNGRLTAPANLWASGGGAADFTDEHIAIGAFEGQAEQDVLVLGTGGADVYEGNGDGEPLPWTSMSHDGPTHTLTQTAVLEQSIDPTNGQPLPGLQWSSVIQVAADDAQHSTGGMPNLWLVSNDGGLYWAARTTTPGVFNPPVLLNTGFQNTAITSAGLVGGRSGLWIRNATTGTLTLYTGTDDIPAGSQSGTPGTVISSPAGWAAGTIDGIFSAGGANVATGIPGLWATDSQAVHNIYSYDPSSTTDSLPTRSRVQTLNPNDDFTDDGQADIIAEWGDGTLHLYTGEAGGKITGSGQIWDATWSSIRAMVSGDFTGDGRSDVIAIWNDGTLHRYDGTGTGGLQTSVTLFGGSPSWGTVQELAAGDLTGDGSTDLVALWNDGTLHLYVNNGQGTFSSPVSLGTSTVWSGMRLLSGSDYNGDGKSDLLAVKTSTGRLFLALGDGLGHLGSLTQSGSLDWSTVKDIIPGDFSGDGKADLAAIWNDGTLHLYTGAGTGSFTLTGAMWNDASWATVKLAT